MRYVRQLAGRGLPACTALCSPGRRIPAAGGTAGAFRGSPYSGYVEILAVLGFGSLSLSTVMQLTELVAATAQDCRTYLTTFLCRCSALRRRAGRFPGAGVQRHVLAMSGFLASLIQKLLLPIMQIYFCFAVCACLWGNHGIEDAAALFARCISWLLKVCGALFSLVLGLQNTLAATVDNAALKTGKGLLQGPSRWWGCRCRRVDWGRRCPTAAQRLAGVGGTLLALAALFAPLFLKSLAYTVTFAAAGIVAGATGQKQCARLCHLYFEGARLCGSVLVLYFLWCFCPPRFCCWQEWRF